MGMFTIVPVWVAQDVTVIILAVVTILFIIRKEAHPGQIFLEFVCFVFLNAAVFENFAVLQGWYGYGRSVLMLFQVPLSVPILEYLVVYSSLRIMSAMRKHWPLSAIFRRSNSCISLLIIWLLCCLCFARRLLL